MIEPPDNIRYDALLRKLLWDEVPEAEEYEILFTEAISTDWKIAYIGGNDTECPFIQPMGIYKVKGRSNQGGGWGAYGDEYIIEVF